MINSIASPPENSQDKCFRDQDDEEQQSIQICLTLQSELHNIGKSLSCPLCLCTLRKPTLLPCNHAFCTSCLVTSFEPKHNRTISPRSGKHVYRNQCPICKIPCTKRCMQESEHLAGLVKAYKKTLRSFGLVPIVYDDKADIAMTQIEETVNFDLSLDQTERDETMTEVVPSLRQCHEHLEVSKGIQEQLKRAMKSIQKKEKSGIEEDDENLAAKNMKSAQELEKINKIRKLDFLLKDQEKVVKVDERALIRAAVSMQKRRSKSNERNGSKSKVSLSVVEEQQESVVEAMDEHSSGGGSIGHCASKEDLQSAAMDGEEMEFENTQHKLYRATNAIEVGRKALEQADESQSQTFFSAPDEDNFGGGGGGDDDDDDDDDDIRSKIIGGLEEEEGAQEIVTTQELMDDAREKEAADRSGEWLEEEQQEEGEEEKDKNKGKDKYEAFGVMSTLETNDSPESLKNDVKDTIGCMTSQVSTHEKFLSANSQQQIDHEIISEHGPSKREQSHFPIGTIVRVSDRTWPGVNKLGGVARIVKVHNKSDAGIKYDVIYVLGGREKLVDSSFVMINVDDTNGRHHSTTKRTASAQSGGSFGSSAQPLRKSRRMDERKQVEEWIAQIEAEELSRKEKAKSSNLPSSTSEYSMKERKTDESFVTKKKKKQCKDLGSAKDAYMEDFTSNMEGNERNKSPLFDSDKSVIEVDHILRLMSFKDVLESAMSHYSSVLKMGLRYKSTSETLFITTSSLANEEQRTVKKMTQQLSKGKVKLKLLRDFNPFKTNILITATSDEFANDENIAKLRTMKAMRSALTGIPIVDMSWCQACLKAQDIVLEANNLVTSLPTKIESYMEKSKISEFIDRPRDFSTASYGVLALASCHHSARSQSLLLFQNIKVFLAGDGWNKETTKSKDVQLLVKEGGGSLIPSALDAIKAIGKLAKELIVILCDDSEVDSSSGISSNLAGAIRESYHSRDFAREKPILVVDSKWLFDSISCAKLLEATYFKPSSPIATSMWHLCN